MTHNKKIKILQLNLCNTQNINYNPSSLSSIDGSSPILQSIYNQTTSASTPLGANTGQNTKQGAPFIRKRVRFFEGENNNVLLSAKHSNQKVTQHNLLGQKYTQLQYMTFSTRQNQEQDNRVTPDFLNNIKQEGRTTSNFLSGNQMYDMKKINAARRQIYQLQQSKKIDTYQSSDINTTQSKQVLQEKRNIYNNNPLLHLVEKKEYCYVKRSEQYSRGKKEANVLNHQKPPLHPKIPHWQASVIGPDKQMTIANLYVKNEVSKLNPHFEKPTLQQYLLGNNGCLPIHSLQACTGRGQPSFCL
jgi:hypothetical protein